MILEIIRRHYPELTRSQRRLADFIAESYRDAAFMTASEMARHLSLNEATVIRFAQRLGYKGFPELAKDVQNLVQSELDASVVHDLEGAPASLHDHLTAQLTDAQRIASHMPSEIGESVITAVLAAGRIFVVGQGVSAALAQALGISLRASGLPVECLSSDPLCLAMLISELDTSSLVIAISLSEQYELANLLSHAQRCGAHTLAMVCSSVSPCARVAEIALTCGQSEDEALPALTPIAATIDALSRAVARRLGHRAREQLAAIHAAQQLITTTGWSDDAVRSVNNGIEEAGKA
ncbi:MAG: MurR/RpiR family transcriptional regulator [Chloroflexi bacterium]|nr:MurR/RpiR family transcriptional regulator [Chloroflexota bacterium]